MIVLCEPDPRWPALFEAWRAALEARLGGLLVEVCHVGSTAIPGIRSKPKIDIDAVVADEAALAQAIPRVAAMDFVFHGDPHGGGMWAFTHDAGGYGVRLYLCAPQTRAHEERLLFRDHLRADRTAALEYEELKLRLAVEAGDDFDAYTNGKAAFVARIVRLAATEG